MLMWFALAALALGLALTVWIAPDTPNRAYGQTIKFDED